MKSINNETDPICIHCIEVTGVTSRFYNSCQKYKRQCPCRKCIVGIICSEMANCDDLYKFDKIIVKS